MAGTAPEREAGSSPSYTLEVDSGDGPALHPGDRSVDMESRGIGEKVYYA